MRLALFDDHRLGAVRDDGVVDLTDHLPWPHDPDPVTAGWWRALARDFDELRPQLEKVAADAPAVPLDRVRLRAPALNPSKIVAAASNYAAHVEEMHGVQERTLGGVEAWMMAFDVFLKAPSSIVGPDEPIVLPGAERRAAHEIHHESELVVVVGRGGRDLTPETAMDHVFGYTIGLDITVRSAADRSRRKSYDSFSPLGPWLTTADELGDPGELDIELRVDGEVRQSVATADLLTDVPHILSHASSIMTLLPGDVVFTGAPPGVGPIEPGEHLEASISRIGVLRTPVIEGS
ncbi:fumarylacetoacetate hydrolase family protein [Nitriliruptoraceae bacterium ZYF776]|nr:fumarylacetoacetate hydrolase family protein [Profundirhabdus halotolerans]